MSITAEIILKAVAQLIEDRLDDLQSEGLISSRQYQKKKGIRQIINAINDADIAVCSDLKLVRQVAIFVPAGRTEIPLYVIEPDKAVRNQMIGESDSVSDDPDSADLLLQDESYLDASDIVSHKVFIYHGFPAGKIKPAGTLSVSSYEQFRADGRSFRIHYEPGSRRLRLTQPFAQDVFLLFEAHIVPYKMDASKLENIEALDPSPYTVRAPGYAQPLLIETALKKLVGMVVAEKGGISAAEEQELSRIAGRGASSGTAIVVPESEYPWG